MTGETPAQENLRFAAHGKTWLIVVRGKRGMAFDRWLVRWTGFSLVSLQYALSGGNAYMPTLLLTTTGRSTGLERDVALPYLWYGDSLVVVGSKAGGPIDPQWVHNIRHNGRCSVRLKRHRYVGEAHVADEKEWREMFDFVIENKPSVRRYQERATGYGRRIPFVVITAPGAMRARLGRG
jgi:deazaflavin-dependent oxidoreductase (nitroreductase family)